MNAETFSSAFTSEKMRTILPNFEMEDEKMKKSLSLLLALLMALSLCACGAGSKSASYEYAVEAPAAEPYMSADMAAEEAGYGGFSAAEGAKFAATMNDFAAQVAALGENKRLEDLRCKK